MPIKPSDYNYADTHHGLRYEYWDETCRTPRYEKIAKHAAFLNTLNTLGTISLTKSNCGINVITLQALAASPTTPQEVVNKAVYTLMLRGTISKKHRFWLTLNAAGRRFQAAWPDKVKVVNADFAEMYFTGDISRCGSSIHDGLEELNPFLPEDIAHDLR